MDLNESLLMGTWLDALAVCCDLLGAQLAQLWPQPDILRIYRNRRSGTAMEQTVQQNAERPMIAAANEAQAAYQDKGSMEQMH